MGLTATFSEPYFTGGSISDVVPSKWPVAINGRPYAIDTNPELSDFRWRQETIPLIRAQADQSKSPAEASLNPNGFWRRAQDSWHHGAGQTFRDRDEEADPYRFRYSEGIDPWTRYRLTLLPDTGSKLSSSNTNVKIVVAGAYIYYADGSTVKRTTSLAGTPSYTSITYAGGTIRDICSDGFNVYVTDGADIYVTNTGNTTLTSTDTTNANVVAYVKARFMAAAGNTLYNIPVLGSASNVMTFVHPNAGFTWTCFAEGTANIFAGGYAGDKSLIYRIAIKTDGTELDAPIVAGELPDGELILSMQGYLGFVFLGTSQGFRMCQVDAQGNLQIGPVVVLGSSVYAFEPQDRFVWFGWAGLNGGSGLGRLDLTQFTDDLVPAYATDLVAVGTANDVLSIATFESRRVFTVSQAGIYQQADTLVAEGSIYTGQTTFGIPDPKTATQVQVDFEPLSDNEVSVTLIEADDIVHELGTEDDVGHTSATFPATAAVSERFEVVVTLTRGATDSPALLRWTLKAIPSTSDGPSELFHVPLLLAREVDTPAGPMPVDVEFERRVITDLRSVRSVVTYQEFNTNYTGIVTDFVWLPHHLATDEGTGAYCADGTLVVEFQRIN